MARQCEFCSRPATTRAASEGESAWVCDDHYADMAANFGGDLRGLRVWGW